MGYYFNVQYVQQYPTEAGWVHFTKLLFTNPAAGSGSQDLITANVLLFPLWTIIDGRRLGMKRPWIYFVISLLTSFGFAMGLYLAAHERQIRWLKNQGRPVVA
jgi:drug/metabolite transporter (DMT)-like permease